ncbi:MAG TPA: hydrogenase, partial [Polyangia bacterium]
MKPALAPLPEALQPLELLEGVVTPASLDDQVLQFPGQRPPRAWFLALAATLSALAVGVFCMGYTLYYGIGTWGN